MPLAAPLATDACPQPRRRRLLWALAAGASALAGCASPQPPRLATAADGRTCRANRLGQARADACVAGPLPDAQASARARQLQPPTGQALLWVLRDQWADPGNAWALQLDAGPRIATLPDSFARWALAPGDHLLQAHGPAPQARGVQLSLRVAAGEQVLVRLDAQGLRLQRLAPGADLAHRLQRLDFVGGAG